MSAFSLPAGLETPASSAPSVRSALPGWLPGRLWSETGSCADYRDLAALHYRAGKPATWADVVAIRHELPGHETPLLAAVGVLSWPTRMSRPRAHVFGLDHLGYGERIRWANRHVRTISRVIVRPSHRGAGLAKVVVAELMRRCPTRYVEATARMAACHPFFEQAGMRRIDRPDCPPYFWADVGDNVDDNVDDGE